MDSGEARAYLALFSIAALAGFAVTLSVPLWAWALAAVAFGLSTLLFKFATGLSGRRARITTAIALILLVVAPGVVMGAHIAGTVHIDNGVPLSSTDNTTVVVNGQTDAFLEDFTILSGTVDIITEEGNMTVFSAGDTHVAVRASEITGPWTNLTKIDTSQNTIQVDPADKSQVTLGKQIDQFNYTGTYNVGDNTVDFVYEGDTGDSRVTIDGVPSNQEIVAVDRDTENFLDVATSNGAGQITFDELTNSQHHVLLQTPSDFADPTLSNASPTGDLQNEPSTIEVDVNDSNFPQGDSVDVTIDLDGSQIHSETISANQTVSTAIPSSGQTGGDHDWTVNATDDFGDGTERTFTYAVPDTLTIRNETNHTQIIDSPITSEVTFFGGDEIVTRETSDGTVNMTGLPVNQNFIAGVVPDDDNYTSRALWLNSIYEQQSVYLLNTSAYDTIESRFILDDPTAQFDQSSVFFIQRPINISGETTWQTIHSDEFGAEGVTVTLEEGQRYRIRIQNDAGTNQLIGPYRADTSETVSVVPGSPTIPVGDFEDGFAANAELNNVTLEYRYADPDNDTEEVTVWIYEKGDQSNRLQANESYFDLGEFSAQSTLTTNESEKTWVVNFIVERNGETFTKTVEVANQANIFPGLPDPWGPVVGIGLLLLLAGAFSLLNAATGAVVVALVGGILFWIGLLGGATTGIGIVLGIFVAVINQIRQSAGP